MAGLVAAAILAGCGDDSPPTDALERPASAASQSLTGPRIFVVGNDRGMIRPCGCSKPTLGGILRRTALLRRRAQASPILAFGNSIVAGGRQQELKLEAFVESLNTVGVAGYCPGDLDLMVGAGYWRDVIAPLAKFPLVSVNLTKDGRLLFQPFCRFEVGGDSVVLTGWTPPETPVLTEPGVEARADPDVSAVVDAIRGTNADDPAALVLFGTGSAEGIERFAIESGLAAAASCVLLVQAGVSDIPVLSRRGASWLLELGQKGRDVAELAWPPSGPMTRHTLTAEIGEDDEARSILDFYRESVAFEKLLEQTPPLGDAVDAYAGSESCGACHRAAMEVWKDSAHARAWATLEGTGDTADPECVGCHVTGWRERGGFDPVGLRPVDVQCEACHGPSARHAADPTERTPRSRPTADHCMRCHDLENSPAFRFDVYWPRIAHGR